jgi:hypothetical protein
MLVVRAAAASRSTLSPLLAPLLALVLLGLATTSGACESAGTGSDSCDAACSGTATCATVCLCDASDCPSFACVDFGEGGTYMLPDGAPVSSCSNP